MHESAQQSSDENKNTTNAPGVSERTGAPQNPRALADAVYDFLEEKKAEDLVLMDLEHVNPYFSIFLIATANSQVQLKSLVRDIYKKFHDDLPSNIGGIRPDDVASGWVIVDFIDVVVHIFLAEQRSFYNLERLWGDGHIVRQTPRKSADISRQPLD